MPTVNKKNLTLDVAARMRLLREVMNQPTQAAFAARYGFTHKQWNNIERGYPLTHTAAIQLVKALPGLSLDWIYLGMIGNLSSFFLTRLDVKLDPVRPIGRANGSAGKGDGKGDGETASFTAVATTGRKRARTTPETSEST